MTKSQKESLEEQYKALAGTWEPKQGEEERHD